MKTLRRIVGCAALALAAACLTEDAVGYICKHISQRTKPAQPQKNSHFCPLCGKPLAANAPFCSWCGGELTQNP